MSNMSMSSILPRSSKRSIPVACSKSVGTVPGAAPGPKRSSSVLTSARSVSWVLNSRAPARAQRGKQTLQRLKRFHLGVGRFGIRIA